MNALSGPAELAQDFVRLNEFLLSGADRPAALKRLVDLAVTAVPGCDWSAITAWPYRSRPRSLAHSGEVAQAADQLQYDVGNGPCMSAAADNRTVHVDDLARDDQFPAFTAAALAQTPVRAMVSFHLAERPDKCALNLYSARAGSYGTEALAAAALFAAHARVLLLHAAASDRAAQLNEALTTSRQIGAAIGVLMSVRKITAEEAFILLRTTSQQLNRKLRLVADDVIRTGTLPGGHDEAGPA